jgi:hypothetical protein
MLRVRPEVEVVDVEIQLVARGLDPVCHSQVGGEVAVARRCLDPQSQPDVVGAVVVENRQRRCGLAVVAEVGARGLFLLLERQVGAASGITFDGICANSRSGWGSGAGAVTVVGVWRGGGSGAGGCDRGWRVTPGAQPPRRHSPALS